MTTWMHIKMMVTDLNVHNAHPMTLLMHDVHFVDHSYQLVNSMQLVNESSVFTITNQYRQARKGYHR